jgi:hemerythrin superfamily protein
MQIYDALHKDHERIRALLDKLIHLDEKADRDERNSLIDDIRDELVPHARAEESVFYNSLRSLDASKEEALHAYHEHNQADLALGALIAAGKTGVAWKGAAQKLKDLLEHHIREEEGKMFNMARQLFTPEEAEMMARAFERLKPEVENEGILQKTLDVVSDMMPARFAAPLRTYKRDKVAEKRF